MTIGQSGGYAIVGIGCRFPGGANSPQAFWQMLADGRSAIGPVPDDRPDWAALYDSDPTATGRIYARFGGFINDIDKFDARFFGISPREAVHIDPQHRFLLETVWQAFEDARIPLDRLAGSDTGVFVGISTHDYGDVQMDPRFHDRIALHTNTGCATSIAANRISFAYDLRGPSMAIDTACSSALTATHLACTALDAGDCNIAIVGGVQLLLRPELTMGFCRATMLSVDGLCKAFDAAGNGYVRAEGAGVVVLKPLQAALVDGDPIHAVILGTSVNQDGRTSSLTIPNEASQRAMLQTSLARAGVAPHAVQYVEAHGPGTAVGDPIEARAIGSVFGTGRPGDRPLLIGSVKTNIGHLEAGSGIAGLIKAALAISNRQIPASLHFKEWNKAIDPVALKLQVVTELQTWPETGEPPVAAVNSFGFGGANASVVIGAAPERTASPALERPARRAEILAISAQTPDALRALAISHSQLTLGGDIALWKHCGAAALGRSHLDNRIAIVASDTNTLADALDAAIASDNSANVARGRASSRTADKIAFVFSGMGPQWWGMGRQLLDNEPVFATMMQRCDAALRAHSGWSLIDEFRADETASRIAHPQLAQVSNFALQVSLAELWRNWGIVPGAVMGHSGGAMAAAYSAGIHTLDDAIWLTFHRSQLQGRDSNRGEMLALGMSEHEARELIGGHEDSISIAAINGPRTVTLSGNGDILRKMVSELTAKQVFARMLPVTIAYHSPRMDPIRDEFLETVKDLRAASATLPFVSDTTGTWENGADCDAAYWWRAIRSPVRFAESISTLSAAGYTAFVEISPHPVLAASINECLHHAEKSGGLIVPSIRRNEDERATMLRSLGALYVNGASPDWSALYARDVHVPIALYPFERDRHWFDPEEGGSAPSIGETDDNPLLGRRLPGAQPLWEIRLDVPALAWIDDHRVQDQVVVPGASYVAMAMAAARRLAPQGYLILRDISFQRPLIVGQGRPRAQIAFDSDGTDFGIFSRADGKSGWTRHVQGRVARGEIGRPDAVDLHSIVQRLGPTLDIQLFYAAAARRGLKYGPTFKGIKALQTRHNEALATIGPLEGLAVDPDSIHPALLDAAFQALIAIADTSQPDDYRTFLPVGVDEVRLYEPTGDSFHVHCRLDDLQATSAKASFQIVDDDGRILMTIIGLTARMIASSAGDGDIASQCFYEYLWEHKPLTANRAPPNRPGLLKLDADFCTIMENICATVEADTGWARYYAEAEPLLTDVAAAHVLRAFGALDIDVAVGTVIDESSLGRLRKTEPSEGRWTNRLIGLLQDSGSIVADNGMWRVVRAPATVDLSAKLPAHRIDLALLDQAARTLSGALSGRTAGRDAIFSVESLPLLTSFYRDAPGSNYYNRILASALDALLKKAGAGGLLRVLEIGAGTGGATMAVLDVLPKERSHYVFTDNAAMLLDGAQSLLGDLGCVEICHFDINRELQPQGFMPGSFDLIVAANVVHATPDIAATLAKLQSLLAPGGVLAMIEITRHPRWLDVVFGQTKGWWAFSDRPLRPEHPLLESGQWRQQLEAAGFRHVTMSTEPRAVGEPAQTVILAECPPIGSQPAPWLLLGSVGKLANSIAAEIVSVGGTTVIEADEAAAMAHLDRPDAAVSGIIDLRPTTRRGGALTGTKNPVFASLSLMRRLLESEHRLPAALWFVSTGAAQLGGVGGDAAQASILGFGRTLIKEHVEIPLRMADLGVNPGPDEIAAFVREITEHDRDEEVAFRGTTRHVRRLRRTKLDTAPRTLVDHPLQWCAEVGTVGSLSSLRLHEFRPAPLAPQEVRIKIEAASINFRDIVIAMGSIQGLEEADSSTGKGRLGCDCAGTVVEVGSAVTRLRPGDAVMGMAPAAIASMVVTHELLLVAKPKRLTFAEAAALPTVAITAHFSLHRLGRIAKGDRVLIHSAAGGVGLSAIRVARDAGAEIFVTAGNEAKREYLRSLGFSDPLDSRSLDFADKVLAATGGAGVDIVLNSLAGEAIERGLACLAPYGRFVEIGKADIYANNGLPMGDFRRNLSFSALDLDQLMMQRRELVADSLCAIAEAVSQGRFDPLPVKEFPMARMEEALRQMAQGRQIGKIVLINDGTRPAVPLRSGIDCMLRGDATYLITGGLGGFGLTVAEHLARGRPGAIVLVGRSRPSALAATRIDAIRVAGVKVEVMAGDVSRVEDVGRILDHIAAVLPPLKGVFHGAMVLDDRRVAVMDDASMERVMAPKAEGAWLLHEATIATPLDHFVLFSSITSLLGNPLQANYAAANACLDGLAHQRHSMGLPALAINWGVLAGSGYVADRPELQRFLEQQGYLSFTRPQALEAFDMALSRAGPQVMAARIDWDQMASYSARSAASPRLAHLIPAESEQTDKALVTSEIVATLGAAANEEKGTLIEAFLMHSLSRILGMSLESMDVERSLADFGLDSLLSVEFMIVLSRDFGFEMPVISLLDDMNIHKLGVLILADLASREGGAPPTLAAKAPSITAASVEAAPIRAVPSVSHEVASNKPLSISIAPDVPDPTSAVSRPRGDWTPLQKSARAICRAGLAALGKVDVEGLDRLPDGPFILAVNHLSMADVPLALSVIPRRTVMLANARLQQNWFLHQLVGGLGESIYLPKSGNVRPALERALGVLRNGGIVALAPEGTRNRSGLGRAETGIAWLASRSGLPVVPYAAWGQEQWRSRLRQLDRLAMSVRIGIFIPPPGPGMVAREYADLVMLRIAALLPPSYRGAYADIEAAE